MFVQSSKQKSKWGAKFIVGLLKAVNTHTHTDTAGILYFYFQNYLKMSFPIRKNLLNVWNNIQCPFLGMYAKLWKVTTSFVTSARLSICMEQLGSHWKDLHEIWSLSIIQSSLEKFLVSLKSDKNNGYFTFRSIYISQHICSLLLRMRKVLDKSCRENKNHTFMFSNFLSKIVPFMG